MGCGKVSSLSKRVWARKKKAPLPPLLEDSGPTASPSSQKRGHSCTLLCGASELVACLTACKHGSCSRSQSWLCRLSVTADLCADTSSGINQAYQRDSCLFSCYKHPPRSLLALHLHADYLQASGLGVSLFTLLLRV